MDRFLRAPEKDTILFVNEIPRNQIKWVISGIEEVSKVLNRKLKILIISEKRDKKVPHYDPKVFPFPFEHIKTDTSSLQNLEEVLLPFRNSILTVVCRGDRNIPYFQRLIPHLPFLRTPTSESLGWATDKINMRRRLRTYNKKISPAYTLVSDKSRESIDKIVSKLSFPVVVKPSGLGASALVSVCYHEEELEKVLGTVFRKLRAVQRRRGYVGEQNVLVEQFMEGTMFSTDIYVNSRGTMYTTPLVIITTGHSAGQEDLFGYKQRTPTGLKKESREKAYDVAKQAVEALGLRSVTAHVELMKTPKGWKVIELGPRVGGFRDFLYQESFGINHTANDILVRLPLTPKVPRKIIGHAVVMKIYPKEEGIVERITGLKKSRDYESVADITVKLKKGDKAQFARQGGGGAVDVYLCNDTKSKLLADIRRVEHTIKVHIAPRRKSIVEKMIPDVIADIPGLERLRELGYDKDKK